MKIYFDNAATTPIHPEVIGVMEHTLKTVFGNPSSIHAYGREARVLIENSRKTVAKLLHVSPSEIFFTSCGTEAINTIMNSCVYDLDVKHIITSPIEHHAVLHTADNLSDKKLAEIHFVNLLPNGHIDFVHLSDLVQKYQGALVCLMHANNEIGNLLSIKEVGELCEKNNCLFLSDMVQTIGKYRHNFQHLNLHFTVCSAHKFHGPKGIGFMYIKGGMAIKPMLLGGGQERLMRSGTENIYGIVGLAKALEIAMNEHEYDFLFISGLKKYLIEQLELSIKGISFNGDCRNNGLYNVVNISLPETSKSEMMLFNLDIAGIAVSGGSACTSGASVGSHVLTQLGCDMQRPAIRFSFSKFNTKAEIDFCVQRLTDLTN